MESVTVETVTVRLVGMEINVNSSVTSPPGRSRKDAHLQMGKSAATEVCHLHVPSTHIYIVGFYFTLCILHSRTQIVFADSFSLFSPISGLDIHFQVGRYLCFGINLHKSTSTSWLSKPKLFSFCSKTEQDNLSFSTSVFWWNTYLAK